MLLPQGNYIDLSKIDFDLLQRPFNTGRKAIEAQKVRARIAVIRRKRHWLSSNNPESGALFTTRLIELTALRVSTCGGSY